MRLENDEANEILPKSQVQDQQKRKGSWRSGVLSIVVTLALISLFIYMSGVEVIDQPGASKAMNSAIQEKLANGLEQARKEIVRSIPSGDDQLQREQAIRKQVVQEQQEARMSQLRHELQVLEQSMQAEQEVQEGLSKEVEAYKQANVAQQELIAKKTEQEKAATTEFKTMIAEAVYPIENPDQLVSETVESLSEYKFVAGKLPLAMVMDKIEGTTTADDLLQAKIVPLVDLAIATQVGAERAVSLLRYTMQSIQSQYAMESGQSLKAVEEHYGISMIGMDQVRQTTVNLTAHLEKRSVEISTNEASIAIDLLCSLRPISKVMWSCLAGPVARLVKAAPWLAGLSQADTPAIGPADAIAAVLSAGFLGWSAADIYRTRTELRERLTDELSASLSNQAKLIQDEGERMMRCLSVSADH